MNHDAQMPIEEEYLHAAALLAVGLEPVAPPSRLRARVLAAAAPSHEPRTKPSGFEEALPGFSVLRADRRPWTRTPFPGVDFLTLSFDRETSLATNLLRLAPGAVFPAHRHSRGEQCWVIEGEVRHTDGSLSARAGDFFVAKPGTDHCAITSEQGCLLLIVSSAQDYVR
ncbi:MAG: cupin domain-containing protein [Bryobacteraceae bacterium]